ncbi:transient receptor potential cation channel subfamily A member 1 [Culicoides brevitarsis]|uniref:transient receptor potential cation channel subfamily A member 1 n=1 Tax=Culicoides brevitarsis TaxID=469753 RepID=UPI00307C1C55
MRYYAGDVVRHVWPNWNAPGLQPECHSECRNAAGMQLECIPMTVEIRMHSSCIPAAFRLHSDIPMTFRLHSSCIPAAFWAAQVGNLEDFKRLHQGDFNRLNYKDAEGRTVIHYAAIGNHINILKYLVKYNGDFNVQDNMGNTPLHLAIENDSYDVIDFFLKLRVKTNILNEYNLAPIHLATDLNKVHALKIMGIYRLDFDVHQKGNHGRTSLHIAAIHDYEECARVLITEFGASPIKLCNNGYYPIHDAAKNASSRTMEVFLQWGEQHGCGREEMICFYDSEGNVPLHSAVHGGDIKAVELCLKSGAKISTQQHDLSTPVHLACAQGSIDLVKIMFEFQPNEKKKCLSCKDIQNMTPLHCASMFDHYNIVEYLVNEGAELEASDIQKRTPLLLAASRAGWKTVYQLIKMGANIECKDINSKNILHTVVLNGGDLEELVTKITEVHSLKSVLLLTNEKDILGSSPIHFCSRKGYIRSLKYLLRLGVCINMKDNDGQSPLHFAVRNGRYKVSRLLLDSDKGAFIINEADGNGLTPLHIGAQEGHTKIVQLLLNRGALLHRDHNGRNPLQLSAIGGYCQTVELLYTVHSQLLDQTDKEGNTALHMATIENKADVVSLLLTLNCKLIYNNIGLSAFDYAIDYRNADAALSMINHEKRFTEIISLRSAKHPCVTLALIATMPKVFETVQNRCITYANCKKDSKSFYIKYSFDVYQKTNIQIEEIRNKIEQPHWQPEPLQVVSAMVFHRRVDLLSHPLSQKYLQMKWNSYGKYFHFANLFFYGVYLFFVTIYAQQLMYGSSFNISKNYKNIFEVSRSKQNGSFFLNNNNESEMVDISSLMLICGSGTVLCVLVNILKEFLQLYQQKLHYIFEPNNLLTWFLNITTCFMLIPMYQGYANHIHYSSASIAIFGSWFNLLLLFRRFDQIGIYIVMFLEILQTLIKVLTVFSILIIAFGLGFFILLFKPNHLSFATISLSLLRTFSMMLGEIDFIGTYVQPYYLEELPFPIPSFIILCIFMILMPILLMNLLIGLAVGDIESVRHNAKLKRLAMQVVLYTEIERKLPQAWLNKLNKVNLLEYPNKDIQKLDFISFILRPWLSNCMFEKKQDPVFLHDKQDKLFQQQTVEQTENLREICRMLDQQHHLLILIIQKMDIQTDTDDIDEGLETSRI